MNYLTKEFRKFYNVIINIFNTSCNVTSLENMKTGIDVAFIIHERIRYICVGETNEKF
jgi:hypothetical protein